MKNKIILFSKILVLMMLTSCNSQNEDSIDLSKEILGKHVDSIITSNVEIMNVGLITDYGSNNSGIETASKELMNFNGVNLYGFFNEDDNYRKNSVKFGFAKKDSIIAMYELLTYQTEKSNQLIKALDDFLGKPNFTSYQKVEDRKEGNYNGKLWEDKINNRSFLLHVSMQKYGKKCWLHVVDNNNPYFYETAIGLPSFSKWRLYLKFKEYNEKPENFTYQDYIKDQTDKGDEYISILTE